MNVIHVGNQVFSRKGSEKIILSCTITVCTCTASSFLLKEDGYVFKKSEKKKKFLDIECKAKKHIQSFKTVSCDFEEIERIESQKIREKLTGRTVLKTYDEEVFGTTEKRRFLKIKNDVNLFGINLCVESLPFQTQDIAVGACASTSLWIIVQALKSYFDLNSLSLYEITRKANEYVEEYRNFPSNGLTFRQALTFLKSIGLDYDILNIDVLTNNSDETHQDTPDIKDLILMTVKAFLKYSYPLQIQG